MRASSLGTLNPVSSLEREYRAEVEHSRALQSSTKTAPSALAASTGPIATDDEEAAKDAESLKLYEDLSELAITNVKIKHGKGGKEVTFTCVQTVEGRSEDTRLHVAALTPRPELLPSDIQQSGPGTRS